MDLQDKSSPIMDLALRYYPVFKLLLQHLGQHELEALVVVNPSLADILTKMQPYCFPSINRLEFNVGTVEPLSVEKLYENIRIATNISDQHPVSKTVMQNVGFLKKVVFGEVNSGQFNGSLIARMVKTPLMLDRLVLQEFTIMGYDLRGANALLVPDGIIRVRKLTIEEMTVHRDHLDQMVQQRVFGSFVASFRQVGILEPPRQILASAMSVLGLLESTRQVVEAYSMRHATLTLAEFYAVLDVARNFTKVLLRIPYRYVRTMNLTAIRMYVGETIQEVNGMTLQLNDDVSPVAKRLLSLAYSARIRVNGDNLTVDIFFSASLVRKQRYLTLISENGLFSVDWLRICSPFYKTMRSLLDAFGKFGTLNLSECRLSTQSDESICKSLYGSFFDQISM